MLLWAGLRPGPARSLAGSTTPLACVHKRLLPLAARPGVSGVRSGRKGWGGVRTLQQDPQQQASMHACMRSHTRGQRRPCTHERPPPLAVPPPPHTHFWLLLPCGLCSPTFSCCGQPQRPGHSSRNRTSVQCHQHQVRRRRREVLRGETMARPPAPSRPPAARPCPPRAGAARAPMPQAALGPHPRRTCSSHMHVLVPRAHRRPPPTAPPQNTRARARARPALRTRQVYQPGDWRAGVAIR